MSQRGVVVVIIVATISRSASSCSQALGSATLMGQVSKFWDLGWSMVTGTMYERLHSSSLIDDWLWRSHWNGGAWRIFLI